MNDLIKRDPWKNIFALPRFFDELDGGVSQRGLKIRETEKNIIVKAVVAGVPAQDVDVHIEDGVLTVKAEKKSEESESDDHTFSYYQYYYTAAFSGGQWNKAEAEIEDGIVTITIPKTEAAQPRKITVKAKAKK